MSRRALRAFLALGAFWCAASALWINKFPLVWSDETDFTLPAWTFLQHGHFGYPIVENLFGLNQTYAHLGRLHLLVAALAFRIAGAPNVFLARAFYFLFGLASVWLVYRIANLIYGRSDVAALSAAFIASSPSFFWSFRDARPEMMATSFVLAMVCVFLEGVKQDRRRSPYFGLSAFLSVVVVDVHPNLIFVTPLVPLALWAAMPRDRRQPTDFISLIIGGALGIGYYVLVHLVISSAALFWLQTTAFLGGRMPGGPMRSIVGEGHRFWEFFWAVGGHRNLPLLCFVVPAVVAALRSRTAGERMLLAVLAALHVGFMFGVSSKTGTYVAYFIPLWAIFIAAFSVKLLDVSRMAGWVFAGGLMLYSSVVNAAYIRLFPRDEFTPYIDAVRAAIPPHSRTFGTVIHWWGLPNDFLIGDKYVALRQSIERKGGVIDSNLLVTVLTDQKIGYLILNPVIENEIREGHWGTTMDQLNQFLADKAVLVSTIVSPVYERNMRMPRTDRFVTRIYRLEKGINLSSD